MKDPVRLLETGASELERRLLDAAAAEEPPADGMRRVMAAVGIAASGASAGAATSSNADAGVEAGARAGAEASARAGAEASGGAEASARAGAEAGGGAEAIVRAGAEASARASAEASARAGVEAGAGAAVSAGAGAAKVIAWVAAIGVAAGAVWLARSGDPDGPDARGVQDPSGREQIRETAPPAAAEQRDRGPAEPGQDPARPRSIAGEVAQLDRVRDKLRAGQAHAALTELDAYGKAHPHGALRQEAALLRIEALEASGDRANAERLARRFLQENPGSPHRARVRALLREGDGR